MLTQNVVRAQLDSIANEISRAPGIYYELYSRLFSSRVNRWIRDAAPAEANLIESIVESDPDYLPMTDDIDIEIAASIANPLREEIFNPDWDVAY